MRSLKMLLAVALFVTTVTLDRQVMTQSDGTLSSSWSLGVSVSQSWALMDAAMY